VRAGAIGRGRRDRPGDGEFRKVHCTALRGLHVRKPVGAFAHACAAGAVVALRAVEGLGKRWSRPCDSSGGGKHLDDWVRHMCDRGGEARHDVWIVCLVVWQTDGFTPLGIASQEGHVECVRVLLDGGAAINQAMVGCASSIAWHRWGSTRGDPW
jgi:hypothetical protein